MGTDTHRICAGCSGLLRILAFGLTPARLRALAVIFAGLSVSVRAEVGAPEPADSLSLWDKSLNLRPGFGYKDNLLLSNMAPERSAFFALEGEATLLRLPLDGHEFFLFAYGKDSRYFDGETVDSEQFVLGLLRYRRYLPANWKTGGSFQYLYQNMVVDASITETNRSSVLVQGHSLKLTPTLRKDFSRRFWLELEPVLNRQLFAAPLDDYWETGPRLSWGMRYGHKSEIALSYEMSWRLYDERSPYTAEGQPVPADNLVYQQHEVAARLRHNWDKAGRWQTTTRLSYYHNSDNGSGYFDYDRFNATQGVRYLRSTWEIRAQAKASYYDYPVQQVSPTDNSLRHRFSSAASLRGEMKIVKHLKLFCEYEHEHNWGNSAFDRYTVNTVFGGVDLGW